MIPTGTANNCLLTMFLVFLIKIEYTYTVTKAFVGQTGCHVLACSIS